MRETEYTIERVEEKTGPAYANRAMLSNIGNIKSIKR